AAEDVGAAQGAAPDGRARGDRVPAEQAPGHEDERRVLRGDEALTGGGAAAPPESAARVFALDRAPPDIHSIERAVEADLADGFIDAVACLAHRVAERDRAEHPAAVRHDLAVGEARAGVEDLARRAFGLVESADDLALLVVAGIARARDDHADGGARVPANLGLAEPSFAGVETQSNEVAFEAKQDRLRFRIPEPAVELEDARRAVVGDHQPGVQEAAIVHAFGCERLDGRLHHFAHDALVDFGRDDRRRRIRAHAARVRAAIVVVAPLVVL